MATYSIQISNNSAKAQTFLLFNSLPDISNSPPSVYSNVYATGRPVQPDGEIQTFSVTMNAFAICGYQEINQNTIVSANDNTPMELDGTAPNVANVVVVDGGPGFGPSGSGAQASDFDIKVPAFDQVLYPDVYVGCGLLGAQQTDAVKTVTPGVKAVATWQADPNVTYVVQPVISFYVATGNYKEGQAVNLTEIGAKVKIDFTNQGEKRYASLEMDSNGTYTTPKFSAQPPPKELI